MADHFEAAQAFVERWEGGWSDHRADPGGLTRWGVTLRTLRALGLDFTDDGTVDRADLAAMTIAEARAVYRQHYWQAISADQLPPALALVCYDAAVNAGPGRAARFLQRALGVRRDGVIGPQTRAALSRQWSANPRRVLTDTATARIMHWTGLSHWAVFGRGWSRRLCDLLLIAGVWLRSGPPADVPMKGGQHD